MFYKAIILCDIFRLIDPQTRLVLVNALYSKGIWVHQFCKDSTREMPFKINKNEKRQVQMMYQDMFKLSCVEEVPATLLIMLYEGMELSLVVLLPGEDVDFSKVENDQSAEEGVRLQGERLLGAICNIFTEQRHPLSVHFKGSRDGVLLRRCCNGAGHTKACVGGVLRADFPVVQVIC